MTQEPDFVVLHDDGSTEVPEVHSSHQTHTDLSKPVKHVPVKSDRAEYLKFGGILLFLAVAGVLMSSLSGFNGEEWMRWFMGGFFIVFGSFKLIGLEMFVIAFRGYDLIAKKYRPYPYIYPFIEIVLGVCYVLNIGPLPRDIITIAIMSVSAVGVTKELAHKSHIPCACLGNIIRLPLTTVSLIENITMGAMALVMLLTTIFS